MLATFGGFHVGVLVDRALRRSMLKVAPSSRAELATRKGLRVPPVFFATVTERRWLNILWPDSVELRKLSPAAAGRLSKDCEVSRKKL